MEFPRTIDCAGRYGDDVTYYANVCGRLAISNSAEERIIRAYVDSVYIYACSEKRNITGNTGSPLLGVICEVNRHVVHAEWGEAPG